MIFILPAQTSKPMTFVMAFHRKEWDVTLSSAILPITQCWHGNIHRWDRECPFNRMDIISPRIWHTKRLRPCGLVVIFTLLLAAQTEKDLPRGFGYLDHAFLGFAAALRAGFLPERRISCPMDGAYLPQHVRRARRDGRLLGQVRDLLVVRKPAQSNGPSLAILFLQDPSDRPTFI